MGGGFGGGRDAPKVGGEQTTHLRVRSLYRQQGSDADGFTDVYAASHVEEYFAQASQYFFAASDYATREIGNPSMEHGALDGPAHLRRTDPDMYAFLVDIYGEPHEGLARAEGIEVERHEDGTSIVPTAYTFPTPSPGPTS